MTRRIALVGLGKMGTALASGVRRAFPEMEIAGFDLSLPARERFAAEIGAEVSGTVEEALSGSDAVILAVKPQNLPEAAPVIAAALSNTQTVLSILAGISLSTLEKALRTPHVVRVMPNLPVTVGKGVCCYAPGANSLPEDRQRAKELLSPSGSSLEVEEKMLDAVTGLSGSGPAFVFEFVLGLTAGGIEAGLPPELAQRLALETLAGSAELAARSELPVATLRDNVISPNGTTAAGMNVLGEHHFAAVVSEAVRAAARRSAELGN